MSTRRGTTNCYVSGNSYDRRRRRGWMIRQFGIPRSSDGKQTRVRCHHCPRIMRAAPVKRLIKAGPYAGTYGQFYSWEVDRWPVCGHDGGKYVRGNIVPACRKCNGTRCSKECRVKAVSFSRKVWRGKVAA